jgi:hypothetical protein
LSIVSNTRRIAGLRPTIRPAKASWTCSRRRRWSRRSGLHHAANEHAELVVVEGLRQIVDRSVLHRRYGDLLGTVRGDHDDRRVRIDASRVIEDRHAVGVLQREVGDHHVEASGLDSSQRLFSALGGIDLIALFREKAAQSEPHALLVVDDENAAGHQAFAGSGRRIVNSVPRPTSLATSIVPS